MTVGLSLGERRWRLIRRGEASPIAELFSGGALGGWYQISDLSTLYQEITGASATTSAGLGDVVGTVVDKSGNGNYLRAPSNAARPRLQQDGNGHYYLDADGVDDMLQAAGVFSPTFSQSFVGYAGYVPSVGNHVRRPFGIGDGAGGGPGAWMAGDSSVRFNDGSRPWDSGAFAAAAPYVHALQKDGTLYVARQNAGQVLSFDRGTESQRNNGLNFGANTAGSVTQSRLYAAVAIEKVLTAQELADVEAYLAEQGGVVLP